MSDPIRQEGRMKSPPNEPQQVEPGWKIWLPRILFAVVAPVLLLALGEGALRLFNVGYPTQLMQPEQFHGKPTSCYNLFFAAPYFPPGMIKTPQYYCVDPIKQPGTYRIVILGESAAMGDPDFAYGFGRYLEVMLRERFPSIKFELINTGMVAINSHVSLAIAKGLAEYKPDLYIVYAGSNEVVGPYGPGTVLTTSSMSLPVIRASIFVRSLRLGQLLTETGKAKTQWQGMEMFLDKKVRADSPRLQPAYRNFESNLRDIVATAKGAAAHVVLCTIAVNLKDSAPFGSLHRDNLTSETLQSWSVLVQQGASREAAQDYPEAIKFYTSALRLDDQYAELHFRLARCYRANGNLTSAKEHYIRARDLDVLRFRADSRINDAIRTAAQSSGQETSLLDTESLFADNSRDGIIGSEILYDHVHFTPLGNYLMAQALFTQIVKTLPAQAIRSARGVGPLTQADCEHLLAFTALDRARVAREMVDRLQRPPFTSQLNHMEQIQSMMLRATAPTERFEDAVREYQWAIDHTPEDLTLHYKFGFSLFDYDRNAAAQQLLLARPTDNFPVFLPDGTQIR